MAEAVLLHIALRLTLGIRMFAFAGFLVSPHTKAT